MFFVRIAYLLLLLLHKTRRSTPTGYAKSFKINFRRWKFEMGRGAVVEAAAADVDAAGLKRLVCDVAQGRTVQTTDSSVCPVCPKREGHLTAEYTRSVISLVWSRFAPKRPAPSPPARRLLLITTTFVHELQLRTDCSEPSGSRLSGAGSFCWPWPRIRWLVLMRDARVGTRQV